MLKQRLLTAAVLIPAFIAAVLWLSERAFAVLIGAVVTLGAWEWAGLARLGAVARVAYAAAMAGALFATALLPVTWIAGVAALWWTAAMLRVRRADAHAHAGIAPTLAAGAVVLLPAWYAIVALHALPDGAHYVLFLIALIAMADSAAYFAGRKWGSRKLAPNVSPGKTWEGLTGALIASVAMGGLGIAVLQGPVQGSWLLLAWCVVTVIYSVVGDLIESLYKRRAGVKDSGRLLPGHGGVLDRIDSLTAAAPVFLLGVILMERAA